MIMYILIGVAALLLIVILIICCVCCKRKSDQINDVTQPKGKSGMVQLADNSMVDLPNHNTMVLEDVGMDDEKSGQ